MIKKMREWSDGFYQYLDEDDHKEIVERFLIRMAFLLFIIHLLLISWVKIGGYQPPLLDLLNINYLSTLYTPFSIILLYEVFVMILSLPNSFTESIKRQYQIISLIVIRRVFKDLSAFGSFADMTEDVDALIRISLDLGSALVMYVLIALFMYVSQKRKRRDQSAALDEFISFKKMITVGLIVFLGALSLYSFFEWCYQVYANSYLGIPYTLNLDALFFEELFTVMIFTDVLIFIASFLYSNAYFVLFRNAGFVVSTVLIRISFTIHDKYGVLASVAAVAIGIFVQTIYAYFQHIEEEL